MSLFPLWNVKEIEDQLNLNFSRLCEWFINKLSIHLGKDKTTTIIIGTYSNIKWAEPLIIVCGNVKTKHFFRVTYLGWWNIDRGIDSVASVNVVYNTFSTMLVQWINNELLSFQYY